MNVCQRYQLPYDPFLHSMKRSASCSRFRSAAPALEILLQGALRQRGVIHLTLVLVDVPGSIPYKLSPHPRRFWKQCPLDGRRSNTTFRSFPCPEKSAIYTCSCVHLLSASSDNHHSGLFRLLSCGHTVQSSAISLLGCFVLRPH